MTLKDLEPFVVTALDEALAREEMEVERWEREERPGIEAVLALGQTIYGGARLAVRIVEGKNGTQGG